MPLPATYAAQSLFATACATNASTAEIQWVVPES